MKLIGKESCIWPESCPYVFDLVVYDCSLPNDDEGAGNIVRSYRYFHLNIFVHPTSFHFKGFFISFFYQVYPSLQNYPACKMLSNEIWNYIYWLHCWCTVKCKHIRLRRNLLLSEQSRLWENTVLHLTCLRELCFVVCTNNSRFKYPLIDFFFLGCFSTFPHVACVYTLMKFHSWLGPLPV